MKQKNDDTPPADHADRIIATIATAIVAMEELLKALADALPPEDEADDE